ncbi:MAG TPA: translation initiation factor [Vicinamibacterales bacterium]|nr:translation initiation factor [Vicinamibacterales bacterium]
MSDLRKPFHNPFDALRELGSKARGLAPAPEAETAPATPAGVKAQARAVVRMERSGRGGKEVTVVEQLDLDEAGRQSWLKALKSALGCGGTVEGPSLVLQGDHRERLRPLLAARGVRKVIVG